MSEEGCLMFSLLQNVEIANSAIPFLNYVICLATVEAVRALARSLNNVSQICPTVINRQLHGLHHPK